MMRIPPLASRFTGGIAALALGFGGGWALSRRQASQETPPDAAAGRDRPIAQAGEVAVEKTAPPARPVSEQAAWIMRLLSATLADMPGLYAEARTAEPGWQPGEMLRALFMRWAELDAPGGWAFVQNAGGETSAKLYEMGAFLRAWASLNPRAALESAAALPKETSDRSILLSWLAHSLSGRDPAAYFVHVELLKGGEDYAYFRTQAFANWSEDDPAAALAYWETESRTMRGSLAAHLARGWALRDPAAVESWARTLEDDAQRGLALLGIAQSTILSDPAHAAILAKEASRLKGSEADGRTQSSDDPTISSVAEVLAQRDLREAVQWLVDLEQDQELKTHTQLAARLVNQSLPADAAAAVAIVASLPEEIRAGEGMFAEFKLFRPFLNVEAGFQALEGLAESPRKEALRGALIRSEAATDPAAAAQRTFALADDQGAAPLLKAVAGEWTRQEPEVASAWLDTLPAGDRRDAAITGFLSEAARMDSPTALLWAQQVSDEGQRLGALKQVFSWWPASQQDQANAALDNLAAPEEFKQNIRTFYQQEGRR